MPKRAVIHTPLGEVVLLASEVALCGVYMNYAAGTVHVADDADHPILAQAQQQLEEYFAGTRTSFDVPLDTQGTEFQRRVWRALQQIPFGHTWSYAQLAQTMDAPKACRAVGTANGRNPLAIIIPCHRVIAADGSIGGYAGGLEAKSWLLQHEARSVSSIYS